MKEYKITEKLKNDLIQHFITNFPMVKVEETVLELRNLPEIKDSKDA